MKKVLVVLWCMAVMFAGAGTSPAQETKIGAMTLKELQDALGMSVYLQGGYTYNFENPDSQTNEFRAFDQTANSMMLDLAQLVFAKDAKKGSIGYRVKFSAGETAKLIHSAGLGTPDDSFDITEAGISYLAPVGDGLTLTYGKMATFIGAEVIEAIDNPNYSRSYLFYYAIPFTHTGLKASYGFGDALNASFYVVNGWDNSTDNNKEKSLGLSVGVSAGDSLSMLFNGMIGPEQNQNTTNTRYIFDWVGTLRPSKSLTVILNYDYGAEENVTAGENARWQGLAGIVKLALGEGAGLALRGEYFIDDDGYRTGYGEKLTLYEVTITPEFTLANGLIVRPEYRHDWSYKPAFDGDTKRSQDTVALGLMYRW